MRRYAADAVGCYTGGPNLRWNKIAMKPNSRRAAPMLSALLLSLAGAAYADGIQPGLWKVTTRPEVSGTAGAPQVSMRCLSVEQAGDIDKTFSPETRAQNSTCERVEHEVTATKLRWRMKCTGQMAMDVTGTFNFDSQRHYSAEITTVASFGGQYMNSRVAIEGEHTGPCP
jgi:hypothetical protein